MLPLKALYRKIAVSSSALLVACWCTHGVDAAEIERLEGEWTGYEFNGYSGWDNGNCTMVWFAERKYDIYPVIGSKDELQGLYAKRLHGRFLRNMGGKCKLPSQARPMGLFANTKTWLISIKMQSDSRATVKAKFNTCFDSGCDDPQLVGDKSDWGSNVEWVSAVEFQDPATTPSKRFFRQSANTPITSEAIAGLDQVLKYVASGDYSTINNRYISSLYSDRATPAGARNSLMAGFPLLRQHLNNVSSRALIEARSVYLFTLPDGRTTTGTFAFIMREVAFKTDARTMEVATVHKEAGVWRIVDYSLL